LDLLIKNYSAIYLELSQNSNKYQLREIDKYDHCTHGFCTFRVVARAISRYYLLSLFSAAI